jgi:hypothetical protein
MTSEELQTIAQRQPFEPFRVNLTTGATYDIQHPDLISVGRRPAIIGLTKRPERTIYNVTVQVDLLHVVGIESMPDSARASIGPTTWNKCGGVEPIDSRQGVLSNGLAFGPNGGGRVDD